MKSANSQPQITGNNTDELKRSLDSAMRQIWSELNKINDKINNMDKGSQSIESSKDGMRLVQDKDNYYLEARFDNGWARLNSTFELITKKE